ncbi:DUF3341 domain-containing protein [bacterium]|nr:DUF3341 domain-containing protein [bacterium]
MSQLYAFDDAPAFLVKLRDLIADGVAPRRIRIATPVPVDEAHRLLRVPPSPLKYFTFAGALTGLVAGFALTIYTALHWPLITSGKPIISLPPFLIIAFELTILLGALASLLGFLYLTRLPDLKMVLAPEETGNRFIIVVEEA